MEHSDTKVNFLWNMLVTRITAKGRNEIAKN
jgi:hypothetical protein